MIKMFDENKVIIAPDLKVKDLQAKDMELDQIIEYAVTKGYVVEDILYEANDFEPEFLEMLKHDRDILIKLNTLWQKENDDPKFDEFKSNFSRFFDSDINPSGKLVLFSESVDTLNYLNERIKTEIGRNDVLMVTAANRKIMAQTIKENFDANDDTNATKYNIIITSDVLAEGVNLHRSNVIINYDSPWNATRLMQRIGRVNRIGSVAPKIYNYMFYPSQQGDKEIRLYKNALVKLQGFHSAFGEDAQIYSREEIVKEFKMFDNNVKDAVDEKIRLLREVRELYNTNRKLYHRIKKLPLKSRVMRDTGKHSGKSIVFVSSSLKTEYFLVKDNATQPIDFLEAVKYLRAKPDEKPVPFTSDEQHYKHVNMALTQYETDYTAVADTATAKRTDLDKTSLEANKFLRTIKQITQDSELKSQCDMLTQYIDEGVYSQLPRRLKELSREYKNDRQRIANEEYAIQTRISDLVQEYQTMTALERYDAQEISNPQIVISESFV